MFEIGREYEFLTGVGETQGAWIGEVLDIALPLLRVLGPDGERIINVGAASFLSARLLPYRSPEEKEAAAKELRDLISGSDEA